MFIRQTRTNNSATGEGYFTFRLVRGVRIGGKVRQITVLNLGRNFAVKQDDWALLCSRIEQLLQPQDTLLFNSFPQLGKPHQGRGEHQRERDRNGGEPSCVTEMRPKRAHFGRRHGRRVSDHL